MVVGDFGGSGSRRNQNLPCINVSIHNLGLGFLTAASLMCTVSLSVAFLRLCDFLLV